MTECALWFWSHGSVFVEMCDDEAEAIDSAISMSNWETGAVAGIQRADGSYTDREAWTEYQGRKRPSLAGGDGRDPSPARAAPARHA